MSSRGSMGPDNLLCRDYAPTCQAPVAKWSTTRRTVVTVRSPPGRSYDLDMARRYRTPLKVRSNGALTRAVGGPPSKNLGKVRAIARGKGVNAARARFFLNVLHNNRRTRPRHTLRRQLPRLGPPRRARPGQPTPCQT